MDKTPLIVFGERERKGAPDFETLEFVRDLVRRVSSGRIIQFGRDEKTKVLEPSLVEYLELLTEYWEEYVRD